jgi:hypothetical protein
MADVSSSLQYLQHIMEPFQSGLYGTLENEARERLRRRDQSDWPVLATALGLACPLWNEDADFSELGSRSGPRIESRSSICIALALVHEYRNLLVSA